MQIKTMAEYASEGKSPEVLLWVGCAGSFDERAKKITRSLCKLLNRANVEFAVLGQEERCTGDPGKRAGNEFLFQMMALSNIQTLNIYEIKKIITLCPHCFNTLKNEYPSLGGNFEVLHHTKFLHDLIEEGRLKIGNSSLQGEKITFHDPCYLGRANDEYDAPRVLIKKLYAELVEMKHCKQNGFCCGAGGAQMFKESEKGHKEINIERAEEAAALEPKLIATGCPFCNTMIKEGIQHLNKDIEVKDIAELIAESEN